MATTSFYADSATPLDPDLSITRPSPVQIRTRADLSVRLGAAG